MDTATKGRGSGHLASKKARTRREIIANAIPLFRREGVRRARSSDIAAAAGISPATLFNYFPTRGDLAEAWVRGELRAKLESIWADSGERGIRAGLRQACREIAVAAFEDSGPRLEAWRAAGRAAGERERAAQRALREAIAREQGRGRLRSDLDSAAIAGLVLDAIEGGVIGALEAAAGGEGPEGHTELSSLLCARVDLVLDGARKRNERVPAPRPGALGSAGEPGS